MRVVADAEAVELVDQLAGLHVHVLDEAREDFHQPPLERTLRLRNAVPRRHVVGARRELGVGGNPAHLLLPREDTLAIRVPAVVELALVLVGPFLEDLVRSVPCTRRPVQQEWLVGRKRLVAPQPVDAMLREVVAQVVFLVVRRLDLVGVLDQSRFPLRGLAGDETVEVVEAVPGRPAVERTHRRGLVGRCVVPLADRGRVVAVVPQHFGDRRRRFRDHAGVSIPIHRALGDRSIADTLVIAPGQKRGARRRADRGRVERVVADALVRKPGERRRVDLAAEGRRLPEADIIDQDDEHVRCARLEVRRLRAALVHGILQARRGLARRRHRRERQDGAVARRRGGPRGMAIESGAGAQEQNDAQQGEFLHASCA